VLAEKIAESQKNEKMIPVAKSATVAEPAKTEKATKIEETIQVAAVADPAPDDSHTFSTPASAPSTILGQITLRRDETLSKIIQRVYGNFNSKYFKSLILANPDIEDPDRVEVGQIISLPAIHVEVTPVTQPVWWVKVDESDWLEDAFNILRNYPDSLPSMRLIPYWTPEEGTRFSVVLHRVYKDELSARNQLEQLPAGLSANSRIVSAWDMKSVYFADPYFGRKP
jgi:hypothetical protein